MKNPFLFLLLSILILVCSSFDKKDMLNHPMPVLSNKTLDGKVIDQNYFKGHITIVSFMFIGCAPCMNEISTLNKIKEEYRDDTCLQILCIARQMKEQMLHFNSDDQSLLSSIRRALGAGLINYTIQPACNDTTSKMGTDSNDSHMTLQSECSTIEDVYGVNLFPTIFYVDKQGIIRNIQSGGPGRSNDSLFYQDIKKEVDLLLAK